MFVSNKHDGVSRTIKYINVEKYLNTDRGIFETSTLSVSSPQDFDNASKQRKTTINNVDLTTSAHSAGPLSIRSQVKKQV